MDTRTLLDEIAREMSITRDEASAMLDAATEAIADVAAELDAVAVAGFGTFETRQRAERLTVHPATGRKWLVPPKIVMSFKPSVMLKNKIRTAD